MTVDEFIELRRHDTKVVTDLADRPSDEEYQRYLTLVGEMKSVGYDDEMVEKVVSFRVRDVFMTAVLAVAADETARMADSLGRGDVADQQRLLAEHARQGVLSTLDPVTRRCRDFDEIRGTWIPAESVASWSVALCGGEETVRREQTGEPAGSHAQSWTAAAIVDWLADPPTDQHAVLRPRPVRPDREPSTSRDRS